jgi:oligopeptidase B
MSPLKPPVAAKRPAVSRHHGIELVDEYAWLRAENWQAVWDDPALLAPEIRGHLEKENAYTQAMLAGTARLRRILSDEMKRWIKQADSSVPARDGSWLYYSRFFEGAEYPRLCRRPCGGGAETVLFDGPREAKGKSFWDLQTAIHSPDHELLAYAVDVRGSELYTIRIRDLASGKNLPDVIHNTTGDVVWAQDSRTLFYTRLDPDHRPLLVLRHTVGTRASADILVYEERDPAFDVNVDKTHSGAFVLIESEDHQTSEVRLIDASLPLGAARLVVPRETGHKYSVEHHGDRLIVTTNSDGAEDGRICEAPLEARYKGDWREIVAHRTGVPILETIAYKRHLVRLESEDGLPRIVIRRWSDGAEHSILFAEEAYSLSLSEGHEYDTDTLRFSYSSLTTPEQIFDYDMETRCRVLRKSEDLASGHNPADYVTRRLHASAPDGTGVPVTLLYDRSIPLDGSAPVLLHGYGSYGDPVPAEFSASWLSLVDRGFILALAHVRGGGDLGHRWSRAGMRQSKLNTFTDFIAVGEHLVAKGYTRNGRIVAMGASAGGTLVGAVANMTPALFLAIIADAPFVDVLNTLLDPSLPLTPGEWAQWGNPIESKQEFDLIRSYSPYENVERKAYPHILAYGGLTDQRVPYWEPAKWVARLRERRTNANLLLLVIDMEVGHDGASGRFDQIEEVARNFAFALGVAGKANVDGRVKPLHTS